MNAGDLLLRAGAATPRGDQYYMLPAGIKLQFVLIWKLKFFGSFCSLPTAFEIFHSSFGFPKVKTFWGQWCKIVIKSVQKLDSLTATHLAR